MFCETERENAMHDLLMQRFPGKNAQLLDLIAWFAINLPERLQEILEQHKNDGENDLIELQSIDIKAMVRCQNEVIEYDDN